MAAVLAGSPAGEYQWRMVDSDEMWQVVRQAPDVQFILSACDSCRGGWDQGARVWNERKSCLFTEDTAVTQASRGG